MDILFVEDSAGDRRLIVEALGHEPKKYALYLVSDGIEAMDFLLRRGVHAGAPRPNLIFLDLNLPRKDGRQLLREIKGHPGLRNVPVVVFTTSKADIDIDTCYGLHANCFVTKPLDLERFFTVVRSIVQFWTQVVSLPPPPHNAISATKVYAE